MVSIHEPIVFVLEPKGKNDGSHEKQNELKTRRKYKDWKGKNKILFTGRIIGGSEIGKLFRTLALVGIPSALFAIFVGGEYWVRYNVYHVLVVGCLLAILSILTLLKTAFTDPGIIPRGSSSSSTRKLFIPPRYQDICINGSTVRLKFCKTCKIFRPPRSFHCPICDNCVERFDHHCPWIGTCIGLRNYGWFSSFIWLTTAKCCFVLSYSLALILRTGENSLGNGSWEKIKSGMRNEPVATSLVVYTFIAIWFVFGLCIFHTYLVIINQTTNEKLRGLYEFGSSYSRGLFGNMQTLCCMIPDSAVHIHHEELVPTAELEEIQKKKVLYVHSLLETDLDNNNGTGNLTAESSSVVELEDVKRTNGRAADFVVR